VREEFRANEGMDVMAKRALPRLTAALQSHQTVVIDGLYSFSEYKLLQREFGGDMVVVAIVSPRQLRYSRLANRVERPLTAEEALARDVQEIEKLEKGGPIAMADYTLVNDSDAPNLLARLDALIAEVGLKP
jgi:dephospho-CoA kinase